MTGNIKEKNVNGTKIIIDIEKGMVRINGEVKTMQFSGKFGWIDDDAPFRCVNVNCDHFFEILPFVHVLGYTFGDRMMDGITFVVKNVDKKPVTVGVIDKSKACFEQLDKEKWFEACNNHCEDLDIAQCPHCGFDVVAWWAYR